MRRALLAALAVLACARPERDAAEAVRRYGDALVQAYRLSSAAGLDAVATADEVRRVTALVDVKAAAKLVLESELREFRVDRVAVAPGGNAATVETTERWRYFDRHLVPGEAPGPTFEAEMAMRYDVVREGNDWKVRSVRTVSNPPTPSGPGAGGTR